MSDFVAYELIVEFLAQEEERGAGHLVVQGGRANFTFYNKSDDEDTHDVLEVYNRPYVGEQIVQCRVVHRDLNYAEYSVFVDTLEAFMTYFRTCRERSVEEPF